VGADNALADLSAKGTGVPQLAIGRVPARTAAELDAYVSKVLAYETTRSTRTPVLLADNTEAGLNFRLHSEYMAAGLSGGVRSQRIYLDETSLVTARGKLSEAWATTPLVVNYVGHGGFDRLAAEGLLTSTDVPNLTPRATPILAGLTCYINYFSLPGYSPLGAELLRRDNGGAVAVWSATGLSTGVLAPTLGKEFLTRLYGKEGSNRLGDLVTASLEGYSATGGTRDMINLYVLLGDPALLVTR
jgi:hypothetical protein